MSQSGLNPEIPEAGDRAWGVFWALDRRRHGNGYEALPISHQEIEACARLYGVTLRPWEVAALDAMERVRRIWLNTPKEKRANARPMTTDLFRSLFG